MKKLWWHWFIIVPMFVLSWVYTMTLWLAFTICGNIYWLARMVVTLKLMKAIKTKKEIKSRIISLKELIKEYTTFNYRLDGIVDKSKTIFDKYPTWGALPLVSIFRGKEGNCEDSMIYFLFLKRCLIKNSPEYCGTIKARISIYMNYFLWERISPHWFIEAKMNGTPLYNDGDTVCFSSGYVTKEDKNTLAKRYLSDDEKYFWILW